MPPEHWPTAYNLAKFRGHHYPILIKRQHHKALLSPARGALGVLELRTVRIGHGARLYAPAGSPAVSNSSDLKLVGVARNRANSSVDGAVIARMYP